MKYYAGIGSRQTPEPIQPIIHDLAFLLTNKGYTLRSGGAPGADTMFECGVGSDGLKEIFLPWKGFNNNPSPLFLIPDDAFKLASQFHPRWNVLRAPVKRLMARNVQQILGKNLDSPVEFVICWTPDGCTKGEERTETTGGTGQAIAIASSLDIPVYNLQRELDQQMIYERIRQ